ncbi:CbbQ/NirQ/NorQ/GpvN family protein [Nocardioides sp.]|uniref:CbbQ/NirQ/NorQ/GpvN family protein n=1 Tax=Nocardioides sp. TaxID=35761 RepID=UPI002604CBA2|nr:CbbQ/NirQ/NorQ/GpvN family protein [Nocardioides sp.]MCU1438967.1 family ATPase [Naasia sp.]MCW2738315.1 family ATPase [Nocardioides sp.]
MTTVTDGVVTTASAVPFYVAQADEVAVFEAAFHRRLPILLKGPTGCGKTRFLEHMAARLVGVDGSTGLSLTTVACHEDLTVSDLVGRHLLNADETVWVDGPLTHAVRSGGLCYLDEIVEARKDTTVVIHPLTDHRRTLPIDKLATEVRAHDDFLLVLSYNPGYQSSLKELKPSTLQRFVAIEFGYPHADVEVEIVRGETEADAHTARQLVTLANNIRNLQDSTAIEGPGTRLLVHAAELILAGLPPARACDVAITSVLTNDPDTVTTLTELVEAQFRAAER